jgi:hypothetical protein
LYRLAYQRKKTVAFSQQVLMILKIRFMLQVEWGEC